MKSLFTRIGALTLLFVASLAPAAQAQAEAREAKAENSFNYDLRKEVVVTGTVASVLAKASPGMVWGGHLLLATASGDIDVSLGMSGLQGRGAISVMAGQQIEMTGITKTIRNRQVFLARTVKVGDRVYAIRNEHGIPEPPQSRERFNQKTAQKEETQ